MPFDGCAPAASIAHAEWIVDARCGRDDVVGSVVPSGFDRCVRVHHALEDGRWSEIAPQFLIRGTETYEYPYGDDLACAEGDMGEGVVDRLVELLVEWSGDDVAAHYGLWTGWGEFSSRTSSTVYLPVVPDSWGRLLARLLCRSSTPTHQGPAFAFVSSCPVIEWFRDMWLFDGPLTAVTAIGSTPAWDDNELWRRSPQWWWPTDRSWFVANEIDWPWSYIAGPAALIDSVLADEILETVEVRFTDKW